METFKKEMTGRYYMSRESQLTKNQWDDLLTSVQQLCRVYWDPSEELSRQILKESFLQPFKAVALLIETHEDAELVELRTLLGGFSESESFLDYLEEGYVRLFINDRGGITAPLYASCYEDEGNPQLMGQAAVGMLKRISDLNIRLDEDIHEPPDHLAIQLEVLYFILTQANTLGRPKQLAAAAEFVQACMRPWVEAFYARLTKETRCRFYPLVTRVLLSILQMVSALPESCTRHRSQ